RRAACWRRLSGAPLSLMRPQASDYRDAAALLSARVTGLAKDAVWPEQLDCASREQLVREFLADESGSKYAENERAWFLLDALVDYRCEQVGDPLRWSPGAVELFLLDFVPRKLSACDETLRMAREVLRAWIPWAAARTGLGLEPTGRAAAVIDELGDEPLLALRDE